MRNALLLALASAHQVKKLHGLLVEVHHSQGWSSVTFLRIQFSGDRLHFQMLNLSEFTFPTRTGLFGD